MPEDNEQNTESQYLLSRQVAHEYHSPVIDYIRRVKAETAEAEKKDAAKKADYQKSKQSFTESARQAGKSEETIQQSFGELETPTLDPVMAFAGGAGGMAKFSLQAGMKLMPSLGRAITSGVVGAAADYPIGAASEALEVKAPKLAMPFSLAVGLLSGVTLERAIEKGVFKMAKKAETTITKEAMKSQVKQIKGILANEAGEIKFGKGYDEKTHKAVVDEINKEIGDVPISKIGKAAAGVPKAKPVEIGDFLKAQPDIAKRISKSGAVRDFAGNLNLSRVENAEQLGKIYGKTVALFKKELGEATRGYRSNKRTQEAAEMLGMTPERL